VRDGARARFGEALAEATRSHRPDAPNSVTQRAYDKAFVAPAVVVIIASPRPNKVERSEQVASAACTGYAWALAAHALGLGAIWKSTPLGSEPALSTLFALAEDEEILGWVNVGRTLVAPDPTPRRLDLGPLVSELQPA
jgi:nitroreductase